MRTEPDISEAVREIVRQLAPYPPETLDESSRLELDLQFDSLALVELAVKIEERFGLPPMSEDDVLEVETVGDIERLVAQTASQPS
jgi:acyl carrier protein